ncbi:MAG: histidinol-phosphate transaminase [Clostridiales bacterium]|nr:histidinol-phosphate transaminase [Clostridiales bacterium]
MSKFLTEKIQKLTPYVPGEQPKERKYIKLNTNESPFPPSDKAIKKASEEAKKLMLYPDPDCNELTALVAKTCNVDKENVILSNGSDEVLNFAFMAYCDEKTKAVFADITYGFYKVFASLNGIPYKEIPLKADFSLDLEALSNEDGTLFIANPNAPTGLFVPVSVIEEIVAKNPTRIVVIDEAYVDFGGESCIPLTKKYDNILVVQTFSKSRSMAGARLGFAVGNKELIADLMRIKYSTNPYNVNRMTAAAGVGAMEDSGYFENNCKKIIENREYTHKELEKLGFVHTNSMTNFVFVKSDKIDGAQLYKKLKDKGILVRHFDKEEIKEYNRITVGSAQEMQALVNAVKEILGE